MSEETWCDIWVGVLLLVALWLVAVAGAAIWSDHKVIAYQLRSISTPVQGYTCIVGQREWVPDVTQACYADPDKALEALGKLRAAK